MSLKTLDDESRRVIEIVKNALRGVRDVKLSDTLDRLKSKKPQLKIMLF